MFSFAGDAWIFHHTYPGQLGPVLRSSDGIRDLVLFVELAGDVQQAGRAFKDGHVRAILFDVHDSGRASVGVDGFEPLSAELAGAYVHVDEVVRNSVWKVSRALDRAHCTQMK